MSSSPTDPASHFTVDLPAWVADECSPGQHLPGDDDAMALVHRLAARNHVEGGGGPFAAVVVDSSRRALVSAGVNLVLASGLSSMHAEVVALSLAQATLGRWDLGAADSPSHELVVNWRPCVMCCGAVLWSGVRRLVVAGSGPELEALTGFDEGPVVDDWAGQFARRGIAVTTDVLREEALAVFGQYCERADVLVYNARGLAG